MAAVLAVAGLLAWGGSALAIRVVSAGRVFSASSIAELPPARAAVVLGCAERLPGGAYNLYFLRRIEAAADLLRSSAAVKNEKRRVKSFGTVRAALPRVRNFSLFSCLFHLDAKHHSALPSARGCG